MRKQNLRGGSKDKTSLSGRARMKLREKILLSVFLSFLLLLLSAYSSVQTTRNDLKNVKMKVDYILDEYGFNIEEWLIAKKGYLPHKMGQIALGDRASDHKGTSWKKSSKPPDQRYGEWYTITYESGDEAALGTDANDRIICIVYRFTTRPIVFGPDMLEYLYANYGYKFYEQYSKNDKDVYQFVEIIAQLNRLHLLSLEFFKNGDFEISIMHQTLNSSLKKAVEDRMQKNRLNKIMPQWIPYSRPSLDTTLMEDYINPAIQEFFPDVKIRVKLEEGTVHFIFDSRRKNADEMYFHRLIDMAIKGVALEKIMHRYGASWIGSRVIFAYFNNEFAWIYSDDCERAEMIDDMVAKGKIIGQRLHFTVNKEPDSGRRAPQGQVRLRSIPLTLSEREVQEALKRWGFYESKLNREGNFTNKYESRNINGDQVVLDHATGLMWHKPGFISKYGESFESAKRWMEDLNRRGYAGFRDWRLPTVEEAASLIENKAPNGFLYIDDKLSSLQTIWTCDGSNLGGAWRINFALPRFMESSGKARVSCGIRPVRSWLTGQTKKPSVPDIQIARAHVPGIL